MQRINQSLFLLSACVLLLFSFGLQAQKSYEFTNEVVMQMTTEGGDSDSEESSIIRFYSSNDHEHVGFDMEVNSHGMTMDAKIINDMEDNTMTTLINQGGMKMAMQYKLDALGGMDIPDEIEDSVDDENSAKPNFRATGKTKTINGYKCVEYEVTSEDKDDYTVVWMTKDLKMASFFESFSSVKGMSEAWDMDMPEGFPMEIISYPNGKGSKEKRSIKVTEINKNKKISISTEGYSIMKLN